MTAPRLARLRNQRLYLIAGQPGPVADWLGPVSEAVAAGVGLVQLRLKQASTDERRAALVTARTRLGADVLLIINDDLEAVWGHDGELLADGVHLGRDDAAALSGGDQRASPPLLDGLRQARQQLGDQLLLGTSTRTVAEVTVAVSAGADHVGFGAMAPSTTKIATTPADPAELSRCLAAHPELPLFPIGGLSLENLGLILGAGCRRAAVSSGVLAADDPAAAVREYCGLLARP